MQDMLLLATVAVIFSLGWFLMKKLDLFLESNRRMQEFRLPSGENVLRLGFCNPMAADGITDALEQYSRLYPDRPVRVFYGTEKELLEGLSAGKFNVIFLPENAELSASIRYDSRMVSLSHGPVIMKYGGLPIEPLTNGSRLQKMVWAGEAAAAFADYFRE